MPGWAKWQKWARWAKQGVSVEVPLVWLLYDEFTTAESAPLTSPRTCEPGPGTIVITDVGDNADIVDGELVVGDGGNVGVRGSSAISLDAGNAILGILSAYTTGVTLQVGFNNAGSGALQGPFSLMRRDILFRAYSGGNTEGTPQHPISYPSAVLLVGRSENSVFYIIDGKLVWAGVLSDADRYPGLYFGGSAAKFATLGALSLSANNYTEWDADFSTVDYNEVDPDLYQTFQLGADCHGRMVFTYEVGSLIQYRIRRADDDNNIYLYCNTANDIELVEYEDASGNQLAKVNDVLVDAVEYQVDIVAEGSSIKVYLDNVLIMDEVSTFQQTQGGATSGQAVCTFVAGTEEFWSHPYPAKGIATDRVIAPQDEDEATHTDDFLCYVRGMILGATSSTVTYWRRDASIQNAIYTVMLTTGAVNLHQVLAGADTQLGTAGAGTISDGDDIAIVADGADIEVFVNGTSVITGTTGVLTGTVCEFSSWGGVRGYADSIEFFPRDVSALLHKDLV